MATQTPKPTKKPIVKNEVEKKEVDNTSYDIDKLAFAIAMAETGNCKKGSGFSHNNCFGIMTWRDENGNKVSRRLKHFESTQQSYNEFKYIWKKSYRRFPDEALAKKWTGADRADTWLKNVKYYYYK